MTNTFSGSEIIELGIQIEKNGRDFYNAAADKISDRTTKDTLKFLAGEEEKHLALFKKMLDSFASYEPKEAYPQEYFEYMNSLAASYLLTKPGKGKEAAGRIKSEKEAINMGLAFEKDSIEFYEGMKKMTPEHEKSVVDELIKQEKEHLEMLKALNK